MINKTNVKEVEITKGRQDEKNRILAAKDLLRLDVAEDVVRNGQIVGLAYTQESARRHPYIYRDVRLSDIFNSDECFYKPGDVVYLLSSTAEYVECHICNGGGCPRCKGSGELKYSTFYVSEHKVVDAKFEVSVSIDQDISWKQRFVYLDNNNFIGGGVVPQFIYDTYEEAASALINKQQKYDEHFYSREW